MDQNSTNLRDRSRLRSIYPLMDNGGASCSLLYDLERTFVIEVPPEFRPSISLALKEKSFEAQMTRWLESEDLLTFEEKKSWSQGSLPVLPQLSDVSLDMSGSCNLGCSYCFENDINSRIGPMSDETARASLDFVFRKTTGSPKVSLHFGSGEPLMRFDLLQKIVDEAQQRAKSSGQQVSFELTTNATLVTREIAGFLRDNPFNVRVSCDGPPELHNSFRPYLSGKDSYSAVERGLNLLIEFLPDRLTVNSVLCGGTRLAQLWEWSRKLGLRHYHVIKVGARKEVELNVREDELKEFRADLQLICDDMFAELQAGRRPIDYQPITKVVRRLMIPEPVTRFCGVAGSYLGVASNGKVYPCFRHLGVEEYDLGDVRSDIDDNKRQRFLGAEAADVDSRPVCKDCWARYLCGGGCYADSTVYGPDKFEPQTQHCPFWRTEIEFAIRFYKRLLDTDPTYCLLLFGDDTGDFLGDVGEEPGFLARKNCA